MLMPIQEHGNWTKLTNKPGFLSSKQTSTFCDFKVWPGSGPGSALVWLLGSGFGSGSGSVLRSNVPHWNWCGSATLILRNINVWDGAFWPLDPDLGCGKSGMQNKFFRITDPRSWILSIRLGPIFGLEILKFFVNALVSFSVAAKKIQYFQFCEIYGCFVGVSEMQKKSVCRIMDKHSRSAKLFRMRFQKQRCQKDRLQMSLLNNLYQLKNEPRFCWTRPNQGNKSLHFVLMFCWNRFKIFLIFLSIGRERGDTVERL